MGRFYVPKMSVKCRVFVGFFVRFLSASKPYKWREMVQASPIKRRIIGGRQGLAVMQRKTASAAAPGPPRGGDKSVGASAPRPSLAHYACRRVIKERVPKRLASKHVRRGLTSLHAADLLKGVQCLEVSRLIKICQR